MSKKTLSLPRLSLSWALTELIKTLIEWGRQLEAADKQNLKTETEIEMGSASIILTGDDTLRYRVEVVAGVLTATPV